MPSHRPARAHSLNSVRSCSSIRPESLSCLCVLRGEYFVRQIHHRGHGGTLRIKEGVSGSQSIKHSWKWNRLANVFRPAHPRRAAFNAHAETCVRYAAVTTQIEIPFKRLLRKFVRFDLIHKKIKRRRALAA